MMKKKSMFKNIIVLFLVLFLISISVLFIAFQTGIKETRAEGIPGCCVYYDTNYYSWYAISDLTSKECENYNSFKFFENNACNSEDIPQLAPRCGRCSEDSNCDYYDTYFDLNTTCGGEDSINYNNIGMNEDLCTEFCETPNTITINGTVKYLGSGEPISGATVTFCDNYQTTTHDNGFFELYPLNEDGSCELKIVKNELQHIYPQNLSKTENHTDLLFEIEQKLIGILTGTVVDYNSATTILGVVVSLTKGANSFSTTTDSNGKYGISAYQDTGYVLTATKQGYQTKIISNFNLESESQIQNINLIPLTGAAEIKFVVKEIATEELISGATIITIHKGSKLTNTTNDFGEAILKLNSNENYPIIITAIGYIPNNTEIFTDETEFITFLKKSTTTVCEEPRCIAPGVICDNTGVHQSEECCLASEGYGWYNGYCVQLNSFCKNDCTFGNYFNNDGLCHAECDGVNGCSFENSDINTCDGKLAGKIFPYNQESILCCEGPIGICKVEEDIEDIDCSNPFCEGVVCGFDAGDGIAEGICSANGNCELPQCQENFCNKAVIEESCMCGNEIAYGGDYCCAGGNQIYNNQQTCKEESVCAQSQCSDEGGNCCVFGGEGNILGYTCPGEATCYSGGCTFEQTYICDIETQCSGTKEQLTNGKWKCSAPCTPLPQCEETIKNTNTFLGACFCGDTPVYTTDNNNYCCDGVIENEVCVSDESITFQGKVLDNYNNLNINDARVLLSRNNYNKYGKLESTIPITDVYTNSNGEYFIDSGYDETGEYKIAVIKNGYEPHDPIIIIDANWNGNVDDIFLNPLIGCEEAYNPSVKAVRGEKAIKLSWEPISDNCSAQINFIQINKCHAGSCESIVVSGAATNYIDENVEWLKSYDYNLTYNYKITGEKTSQTTSGSPGMPECEGRYDDENKFCYGGHVVNCDQNNIVKNAELCEDIGSFASTCVETSSTEAECRISGECGADTQYSLFGMFYDVGEPLDQLNTCHYIYTGISGNPIEPTNCYYDYSLTNIDSCYSCNNLDSIYAYKSKNSCEEDRCGSYDYLDSWNNPYLETPLEPQWTYLNLGELGRGLCYQTNYDSAENCDMLNSDIFTTLENSEEICRALGNCYPNTIRFGCDACNYINNIDDHTKCEDFTTKETCIGNTKPGGEYNVSWDKINLIMNPSNDACHLSFCRWNGTTCFKDGNASGIDYCSSLDSNTNKKDCRSDFILPIINLTNTYLSSVKDSFDFVGNEEISYINLTFNEKNNITLPDATNFPILDVNSTYGSFYNDFEDGLYNVTYFGEDKYHLRMDGKTELIYVDYHAPNISIIPTAIYDESTEKTTVNIFITSDEYTECNISFTDKLENQKFIINSIIKEITPESGWELEDGFYDLNYKCVDLYGNAVSDDYILWIDNNRQIIPIRPSPFESINYLENQGEFTFIIDTLDQTKCTIEASPDFDINTGVGFVGGSSVPPYPMITTTKQEHTFITNLTENQEYNITYTCEDDNDQIGEEQIKIDVLNLTFYNDNRPPVTTFSVSSKNDLFYLDENRENIYSLEPVTLNFNCQDLPKGFLTGCDIYINGELSTTNTIIISGLGEHTLTYYSKDKITDKEPNIEETKTINVFIGEQTEIELSLSDSDIRGTKKYNEQIIPIIGIGKQNLTFNKISNSHYSTSIVYNDEEFIFDDLFGLGLTYYINSSYNPESFEIIAGVQTIYGIETLITLDTDLIDNLSLPIKIKNPYVWLDTTKPEEPRLVYPKTRTYTDMPLIYIPSLENQRIIGYDGKKYVGTEILLGILENKVINPKWSTALWVETKETKTVKLGKQIGSDPAKTTSTSIQNEIYITNIFNYIDGISYDNPCTPINGKYVMFGENSKDETYLIPTHEFYEIISCQEVENELKLNLSSEVNVGKGIDAYVFDSKDPEGRFELEPIISGSSKSEFYYYLFARNQIGTFAEDVTEFKVVLDNNTPYISNTNPNTGALSANSVDEITFTVSENLTGDYSGLDEETLKVKLTFEAQDENDYDYTESFDCNSNNDISCELVQINNKVTSIKYIIKNNPPKINLSKYGKYIIDVEVDDYATNKLDTSFWFGRDKNIPYHPNVSVSPAPSCKPSFGWIIKGDTIYTNSTNPNITIDFTDTNDVEVLITRFAIDGSNYINVDEDVFNTTSKKVTLEERQHSIEIFGRKKKEYWTNEPGLDPYYDSYSITNLNLSVDNTPPTIALDKINYINIFNYGIPFEITGRCSDPNNGADGVDYVEIGVYGSKELNGENKKEIFTYEVECEGGRYSKEINSISNEYYDIVIGTFAIDKVCLSSEIEEQYLTLDDKKPTLEINAPSMIPINHTTITINAKDNKGLKELKVQMSGGGTQRFNLINSDGTTNLNITEEVNLEFEIKGQYSITATITDLAGNTETKIITIKYDDTRPEIDIISPEIDIQPNKAIVNETELEIKIKPLGEVLGCVYSEEYRKDDFYNLLHKMNSIGNGTYTIEYSFNNQTDIYFKCNYFGMILNKNLTLIYDNTAPKIQLIIYEPNPVVERDLDGKLKTTATIQTDDYVKCKYSPTPPPNIYIPDGTEPSSLSTNWEQDFTNLEDKTTYTYYYQCENGVGLISSTKNTSFTVNTSIAGQILSLEPTGCTNTANIQVILKTNKISICNLKYGSTSLQDKTEEKGEDIWATTHIYNVILSDNEDIKANCEFISGAKKSKEFKLVLDITKPTIENIMFDDEYIVSETPITNLDDDLKFKINATTDCYPIEYYDYTLWYSSILLINETGEKDKEITIDPDDFEDLFENYTKEEYLLLLNGTTLLLKSTATNDNGKSNIYPQNIKVDTSFEPANCFDGEQNGDEEGVDCGGSCSFSCLGGNCTSNSDCPYPAQCTNGICIIGNYSHCENDIKDADETDVDCGGLTCSACSIGQTCNSSSDCNSDYCDNETNTCQNPSCSDGVKNRDETDVDCGGSCDACGFGQSCEYNDDCETNYCEQTTNSCQYPTCDDGIKNGNETDVDCGGNCEQCEEGLGCLEDEDCLTGYCTQGSCIQDPDLDTDEDGLPDWWEEKYFGCATCADPDEDSDKDGKTNIQEYIEGTNPTIADVAQEINLVALVLLLLGGLLVICPALYLAYKQQMKQNKPTPPSATGTSQLSKYKSPIRKPSEFSSPMDKNAYLNYMKKKWGREKQVFGNFSEKEKQKIKSKIKEIPRYEHKIETPIYDKYKGRYLTLAELKQKVREAKKPTTKKESDVFDKLVEIKQLSKSNKTLDKKLSGLFKDIKSGSEKLEKEDVFVRLANTFGTDTDAFSKINDAIGESKKVSEKQLLDAFTSIAVHDKLSVNKNIFKVILSYLLKAEKISKADISQLMFDLQKRNIISSKDISEVLFDLDIDFDKTRK